MTTYEQFKEALLKATSDEHKVEIMELKFGCNLNVLKDRLFQGDAFIYEKWKIIGFKSNYPNLKLFLANREYNSHNTKTIYCLDEIGCDINWGYNKVEILGRDLTIEDVLIAISNKFLEMNGPTVFFTPYKGVRMYNERGEQVTFWRLGKFAHEQTDETLKELINLLEGNKEDETMQTMPKR